jgi:hypothetical protein
MSDVVYVIGPKDSNTVKIGFSDKPRRRLRQIQMMSPLPLDILWSCPGGRAMEDALHVRFREYRTHGEWFTFPFYLPPAQTIRAVATALEFAIDGEGRLAAWPDVPTCTEGNRKHWLNMKIREAFDGLSFTFAEAAEVIGAPESFVEAYGGQLAEDGSLVEQTTRRGPKRAPAVYVATLLDEERWNLLGPRPAERTSAME